MTITNENEYSDDHYADAITDLRDSLNEHMDALWSAGATIQNIQGELDDALRDALEVTGAKIQVRVNIEAE